jgi:hypothetical protein
MPNISQRIRYPFADQALRGLLELGPDALNGADLSLELGLSIWMRSSGMDLLDAISALRQLTQVVTDEAEIDAKTEPIALVGRSPRADVTSLARCLGHLIHRAALVTDRDPWDLVQSTLGRIERECNVPAVLRALA